MVRTLALLVLLSLIAAPSAQAQLFLELAGQAQGPILGNATFSGFENQIIVSSFNQGQFTFFPTGPGGGSPVRNRSSVTISKPWDPSSIKMIRAQGEEELLTTCVFRFLRLPPTGTEFTGSADRRMPMEEVYFTVELYDARIESFSVSGQGTDNATESVQLSFSGIRYTYNVTGATFFDDVVVSPRSDTPLAHQVSTESSPSRDPLAFDLPQEGSLGIEILDQDGRWVTTLFDDDAARSEGRIRWDATDTNGQKVPAGVYTATVRTNDSEITRRMVIGG